MENTNQPQQGPQRLKLIDLLKLSMRAFYVRPMRTFLTILGMSVGIGTVFALISMGYGLQYILVGKLAANEDALKSLEVFYPGDGTLAITEENIHDASHISDVEEVSAIAETPGEIELQTLNGSVIVKIVDENYFRLSGLVVDYGIQDIHRGLVLSSSALQLLNKVDPTEVLNQNARLKIQHEENMQQTEELTNELPIVGVIKDDTQAPYVYVCVRNIAIKPETFVRFYARANTYEHVDTLRSHFVEEGFLISARIDTITQARKITTAITIILAVFGVAALVVSSIGMFNTMLISFMERIFEVGIMKSLGATTSDIRNLFLTESIIMGLLGGIGGLLIGLVGSQLFNGALNLLAYYLGGKPVRLFIYPMSFVVIIIVLSGIVGALSGFWPARRAAKLSAREAFLRK